MDSPNSAPGTPPPSKGGGGSTPDDPRIGTLLAGRYRIHELLGEGGMGRVYAAEHELMRKRVAIKVLHRELTTVSEVVRRFEREAMAAANIDHPNVAAATDFGKLPDGSVFLVLEYVQGISLRTEIARGPMPLGRVLHIGAQIASALTAAHRLDIVHRDLKPDNVMLVERSGDADFVKVLDFGIAKVPIKEISERGSIRPGQAITKVGMVFGTPEYMAPEQALGQDVDGRADLFALGVILYEMIAGRRPYRTSSAVGLLGQQLQGPMPPFSERAPGVEVPEAIERLIATLLSADREIRPAVGPALGRELERLLVTVGHIHSALRLPTDFDLSVPSSLIEGDSLPNQAGPEPLDLSAPVATAPTLPAPAASAVASWSTRYRTWSSAPMATVRRLRARLPESVRSALVDLSDPMLLVLAVGTVLGFIAVVLGAITLGLRPAPRVVDVHPAASGSVVVDRVSMAPVIRSVSDSALATARAKGLGALTTLSNEHPNDPKVITELAKAQLKAGDTATGLNSLVRALSLDPRVSKDAEVASALWKAVQLRESADQAFAILQGPMGERGADILFDLMNTPAVRGVVRQKAEEFFDSGQYEKLASPALRILISLRDAETCRERHELLTRVIRDADQRILPLLNEMRSTHGCGVDKRGDCFACLRTDDLLARAIEAVRTRRSH